MAGFGDFLAAIANRLGQQAQATQQGTLGLGPDPNAPPAPFGHPLSIHYGALPGFLAMPLRAAITPLQMAGLVGEAGQVVGRMGTGTAGAGVAALQNALNSPYGGAVSTLAHTAPVLGSLADAIQVGQHLGRLNPMEIGPLHTADAQRALAAFRADPGIQGEVAANEALAQGNKYATGLANTLLSPLNYAGMTGELGAALRLGPALDALGGSGEASLAAQGAGRALQGLSRAMDAANAPASAAFSGAFNLLRGRGPVAALTAAGEHLGLGGFSGVGGLRGLAEDLAGALQRPGAPQPLGPSAVPYGPHLPPVMGPPAPLPGGGFAAGVPFTDPQQIGVTPGNVPRSAMPLIGGAPGLGPTLPPQLQPIAAVPGNVPRGLLPLVGGIRQLGPELPPVLGPPVPPPLAPFGPPIPGRTIVPPTVLPAIDSWTGNVPRGTGPLGPALPPELQPPVSVPGNVPRGQGPLGPPLPPDLMPAASIPGNVPKGTLGPPPPPVYGPPKPGRVTVPPTILPPAAAPPLPNPAETLAEVLGTAAPPAAAAPAATPLEAFLGDTAATYRTPGLVRIGGEAPIVNPAAGPAEVIKTFQQGQKFQGRTDFQYAQQLSEQSGEPFYLRTRAVFNPAKATRVDPYDYVREVVKGEPPARSFYGANDPMPLYQFGGEHPGPIDIGPRPAIDHVPSEAIDAAVTDMQARGQVFTGEDVRQFKLDQAAERGISAVPPAAPAAAAATNWADRAGVIRQVANAPLAHLNSVLADLHNALYPGRQADFAIPSLTGQPKAAFRTSMLTDAAGQNRAEPYLDYLLNRVQKDPAAATRLAAINPTLADDATRLAPTDLAPDAHKAAIQVLFKGPPGTLEDFNALLQGPWSASMYVPEADAFAKRLNVPIAQARRWIDDAIAGGTLARDATGQLTFAPRGPGAVAERAPTLTARTVRAAVPDQGAIPGYLVDTIRAEQGDILGRAQGGIPYQAAVDGGGNAIVSRVVPAAAGKEPWQLTRQEWQNATAELRHNTFDTSNARSGAGEAMQYVTGKAWLKYDVPELLDREFGNRAVTHRDVVLKALSEGKTVPPAVLAEYPDLAAQALPIGDIAAGGGGQGLGLLPPRLPQTLGGAVAGGVVGAGLGAAGDEDNRLRGALKGAGLGVLAGGGLGSGIPDAYAAPLGAIAKEGAAAMREAAATGERGLFPKGGLGVPYIRALRKTGLFVVPRNALGAMGNVVMGGGDLPQALRYAGEFWQNMPTLLPALRAAGSDEAAKAAAMYAALPADMQQYGEQGIATLMGHSGSAYERNAADLGAANVHPLAGALRGGILAGFSPRTAVIGAPSLALGAVEGATLPARAAIQNALTTGIDVPARLSLSFPAYAEGLRAEAPGFIAKVAAVDPALAATLDPTGKFDPSAIVSSAAPGSRAAVGLPALADEWAGVQEAVAQHAGGIATDRMGDFTSPGRAAGLLNAIFPGGVWNMQQAAVLARAAAGHPALALAALNAMQQDYQAHVQRGDPQHAGTWELTDKTPGFGALVRLANGGGPGSFYVNPAYPFSPFSGETLNLPRELDPRLNPNQTLYDRAMKVGSALGLAVNPEIQMVAYKEGASSTPMTTPLRLEPVGQYLDAKTGLGLTANPIAQGLDPQGSVANMEDINLQLRRGQYLDPAIARSGAEIIYEQTGRPASDPSNAPLLAQLRDHSTPLYQQSLARGLGGKAALAGINEALPVSGQAEGQTAGDVARAQMQLFARGIPFTKAQITALAGGDMTTASMAVQAALDRAKLANPILAVNDAASPQAQAQALASDFIRQNRGLQGLWPELFNVAYQAQQERLGLVPAGTMAGLQQQMDWRNAGLQPGGYMIGPGMPMPDYSNAAEGVRQLMRDRLAGR